MHRFKTKDQSEKDDQLQGGHSNLAGMQLNWFLKSKSQLRVWLNNSKIDWFGNKTFWRPFLLKWNNMFCSKRCHFHYSLKKELQTMLFWWHCLPSSSPRRAKAGEKGFPSPPLQHLSLSLAQKSQHNPHPLMAYHHDERGREDKPCEWLHRDPPTHLTLSQWLDKGRVAPSPTTPYY